MGIKKIAWVLKRHPFLYLTRLRLLSRNSNVEAIAGISYNSTNNKADIPDYYYEVNARIFKGHLPDNDIDKIKKLSCWLRQNIKGGPGLSETSENALRLMLEGKGGVCSDIAQVFNNFCVINDIKVREWGVVRAPFDKTYGGHSFNEFYSKELNKWVLIDVSWNILFYDSDNRPLSVLEYYKLFREGGQFKYESFATTKVFKNAIINKNYLQDKGIPFLICRYSNKTYDDLLKRTRPYMPVFMVHFFLYVLGKSYHYKFPLDNYKTIFA